MNVIFWKLFDNDALRYAFLYNNMQGIGDAEDGRER